jgi:hypothetical protein
VRELFRHPLRWVLQDKVGADASRVTSTFTFIDAAHRCVILAKVQKLWADSLALPRIKSRGLIRTKQSRVPNIHLWSFIRFKVRMSDGRNEHCLRIRFLLAVFPFESLFSTA